VRADAALLHLRWATPGLAVRPENTHPFLVGDWAFGHNGAVRPAEGLLPMLSAAEAVELRGDTDSERLLHVLLARVRDHGLDEGVRRTVADVCAELTPSSLNALLLGRKELTAVCCHGAPSLGDAPVLAGPPEDQPGYFDLRWRQTDDAVIVTSEPLDEGEWAPMRNGTALVIERSKGKVRTVDIGTFPPAALAREQSRRSAILGAP
jgi:predicted glutamine amidotransferase